MVRDPTDARVDGVTPRAVVLDRLADAGGQLPERRLVMETPYGSDACDRVLDALAADGEVDRRDAGSERVVCLADAAPATSRDR
ncbi:MAG: hypothetical protein ABEJ23_05140 [Haloarculaceae archaeon]